MSVAVMDAPFPAGLFEEMHRVIAEDRDPPGIDSYSIVFDSPLLFPLQRRAELEHVIRRCREFERPAIMDIGTDKGGGAYHWLKCLNPSRFIAIEIRGLPYATALSLAFPCPSLWLPLDSQQAFEAVKSFLGLDRLDVLWIDGDKNQMHADFERYLPLVRKGGLVFLHDVADWVPNEQFVRACRNPRVQDFYRIRDITESEVSMAREIAGVPPATAHEGWLRHWKGRSCGVGVLRV